MTPEELPESWREAIGSEFDEPYFQELRSFVAAEREQYTVYPAPEDTFHAFRMTPLDEVKVFIVGQDPYHGEGQAHGLCFSVLPGVKLPPSLKNIYKEMHSDIGCEPVKSGTLDTWASQGVLLLNTVLTVRASEANSHRKKGWERFTDAAITAVAKKESPVVFILWGKPAQKKAALIESEHHTIITSAHPSPLSARNGFFGSRPFSRVNTALTDAGLDPIRWELRD